MTHPFPIRTLLATLAIAAPAFAAAPVSPETPLIVEGDIKVQAIDFDAALLRVPERHHAEVRAGYDRVAGFVDGVYITRVLAAKAQESGIDKDPVVRRRMQQAGESVLADLYYRKLEKETPMPDLEQRARELYRAEPKKYTQPESTAAQHILVNLWGRTKEMALERAKQVEAEVRQPNADFLALVQRYSDDPEKIRNRGALMLSGDLEMNPAIAGVLKKLRPGEISEPIDTERGYLIIKLVERRPATVLPFEQVKKSIMDAERDRILKKRSDDVVEKIRSSPTVIVHRANVEALVKPIDPEVFKKAASEPASATK